ncbi:glycosyltransferase [Oceanobacillus kapialis]|uniref:Glycosyltransferase n=1 Tax=Oceanobacillus kapialis TaxID=481353 RepID=A0ABW5PX23_9BACI
MSKNVCMFVWNHFTNDARVLRECTALSENGYSVDLICIDDPSDSGLEKFEKKNENFHVYRVRRYPALLELLQKIFRKCMQNKMIGLIAFLIWLVLIYINLLVFGSITILAGVLLKTKLKVVWVRGSIIFRMVASGFNSKYDIYHSNDLNTLPQGYICSKFRINKKKLIYDSHEVQTSRTGYDSKYHGILESFLIKRIDTMIVENHTRAHFNKDLYGFYPNVIHNYPFTQTIKQVEKAPLQEMLKLPQSEKVFLYQGGIQAGRGLDKLIKAVPLFKEGTLVLIGDGKIKPQLVDMVNKMKLDEKVKFLPKVPVNELPSYTKNAYLGFQVLNNVNFNHYSASSNKLFEYIMSDVPVVACSFPEIKKVVEGEQVGLCIDSHSHESIAFGVNTLLEDNVLYQTFKDNCLAAKKSYNWENETDNFLTIYNEVSYIAKH